MITIEITPFAFWLIFSLATTSVILTVIDIVLRYRARKICRGVPIKKGL